MARTTKATLRRGRERRKALAKANKKMANLSKRLDKARKEAAEKFGKSKA